MDNLSSQPTEVRTAQQAVNNPRRPQEPLQELRERVDEFLVAQEARHRLWGRRLHNEVGQLLSVLCMRLQTGDPSDSPTSNSRQELLKLAQHAMQAIRGFSLELEPSIFGDLPLPEILHSYLLSRFSESAPAVDLQAPSVWQRLAPELEAACFRTIQEVVGYFCHEQGVQAVQIQLRQDAEAVLLTIAARGGEWPSTAAEGPQPGRIESELAVTRARVELLGGQWKLDSEPLTGEAVEVRLPIASRPPNPDPPDEAEMC